MSSSFRIDPWPSDEEWSQIEAQIRKAKGFAKRTFNKEVLRLLVSDLAIRNGYPSLIGLIKRFEIDSNFKMSFLNRLAHSFSNRRKPDR